MSEVSTKSQKQSIPPYVPKRGHELPMFFENKESKCVNTQVVPALDGKILRGLDKVGNYDFIFVYSTKQSQ